MVHPANSSTFISLTWEESEGAVSQVRVVKGFRVTESQPFNGEGEFRQWLLPPQSSEGGGGGKSRSLFLTALLRAVLNLPAECSLMPFLCPSFLRTYQGRQGLGHPIQWGAACAPSRVALPVWVLGHGVSMVPRVMHFCTTEALLDRSSVGACWGTVSSSSLGRPTFRVFL